VSIHGYIALSLGIVLSLLVWIGLVYLSHISARDGHDDIHTPDE